VKDRDLGAVPGEAPGNPARKVDLLRCKQECRYQLNAIAPAASKKGFQGPMALGRRRLAGFPVMPAERRCEPQRAMQRSATAFVRGDNDKMNPSVK
jgi:hypothetical protein